MICRENRRDRIQLNRKGTSILSVGIIIPYNFEPVKMYALHFKVLCIVKGIVCSHRNSHFSEPLVVNTDWIRLRWGMTWVELDIT